MAHGIFARIKGILLSPKTEWPLIAAEPKTSGEIYIGYVLPLVAIGVLATFLGNTIIGVSVLTLGFLYLLFNHTRLGLAMRAAALYPEVSQMLGVRTGRHRTHFLADSF